MKNQTNRTKIVIGQDETGIWLQPKKLAGGAMLIFFLLFLALFSNGQTVTTTDGKTYTAVHKAKTASEGKLTGKTFVDAKGNSYPILQSEGGSYYYMRTSKAGNIYKAYIKL